MDYYANMGDTPVVMFQRDKHGNAGFNTQFESLNGFQWVIDDKGDFFDLQGFKQDPNFGIYKVFPKRSKTLIMKSQP